MDVSDCFVRGRLDPQVGSCWDSELAAVKVCVGVAEDPSFVDGIFDKGSVSEPRDWVIFVTCTCPSVNSGIAIVDERVMRSDCDNVTY